MQKFMKILLNFEEILTKFVTVVLRRFTADGRIASDGPTLSLPAWPSLEPVATAVSPAPAGDCAENGVESQLDFTAVLEAHSHLSHFQFKDSKDGHMANFLLPATSPLRHFHRMKSACNNRKSLFRWS